MFTEILSRIKAPTPKFFKKIQVLGASIVVFGTGITQIPSVTNTLVSIGTHAIVAGGVIVLIAKLAIENVIDPQDDASKKTD